MQKRSALWKRLAASGSAKLESKAVIDGAEYPEILNPSVSASMCPDALSVGNCVSSPLQFSIRPAPGMTIPDNAASITVKIRFTDGEQTSEWMTVGTFYANRRMTDAVTGTVAFQGFDAMRKADAPFPNLSGFPKALNSAIMEIARNIGVEVDERTWANVPTGGAYFVPLPADGEKMIKVLGYIGGVCGGNWIITPRNKLRLVPFVSASGAANAGDPASIVGITGRISTGNAVTVTGVSASSGSKTYFAGSEAGAVMRVLTNPYMTQAIANALLSKYGGLSYVPYSIEKGLYDPALEIGDFLISRSDIQSVVCQQSAHYGPAFRGDLSAPFAAESDKESQSVSETIAQSGGAVEDLSVRIYKFTNQSAVTVGDGQSAEIINFDYAAGAGQDVIFHAEIKHTTETTETGNATDGWTYADAVITVTYYINGAAVTTCHPVKAETDGANLLHLTYHFTNGAFNAGNFRASIALSGGSVSIAAGDANAYIIGQGYSGTDDNWITEDGLIFIGAESYPDKLSYVTGDALDLTGLVMKAYYADGTETDITRDCVITPPNDTQLTTVGEVPVSVSYTEDGAEFRDSFSVYCFDNENPVIFIDVTTPPTKTAYLSGERLNLAGIVISAYHENGWITTNVKPDCVFTPAEGAALSGAGIASVNVAFRWRYMADAETFRTSFYVEVIGVQDIVITSYPDKTEYVVRETLDYTGLEVTAYLSDGTERDVTADCAISPAAGTTVTEAGDITITVSYRGEFTDEFQVSAEEAGIIASGDYWKLYETGLLYINCPGDMMYCFDSTPPWYPYRDDITSVILTDDVEDIYNGAFDGCENLVSVTIPSSVTEIESEAFRDCERLTSVTISYGVGTIESNAFEGCSALTSVAIPDSVSYIGDRAFTDCSGLTSVVLPASVSQFGSEVFAGCASLTSVSLPYGVTRLNTREFYGCYALTSVTLPQSVTEIESQAFYECYNLASVNIPSSVTSIGSEAFAYTSITSAIIPNGVSNIENGLCYYCERLTSVTIPASVTSIGDWAFSGCVNLPSVAIPVSVTQIGDYAFRDCESLSDIYYSGTAAQWSVITIGSDNDALTTATIHYNS